MKYKAKILGHKGFVTGTLESSAKDGFNDMIKDEFGNLEYIDVTTIETIGMLETAKQFCQNLETKQQAFELANNLEERVAKMNHSLTYEDIVETSILIAEITKEQIPMYTGNLNPKWKLWDETIKQLNTRAEAF